MFFERRQSLTHTPLRGSSVKSHTYQRLKSLLMIYCFYFEKDTNVSFYVSLSLQTVFTAEHDSLFHLLLSVVKQHLFLMTGEPFKQMEEMPLIFL